MHPMFFIYLFLFRSLAAYYSADIAFYANYCVIWENLTKIPIYTSSHFYR
ncbi:hypothetical protein SPX_09680 [Sporomusa paucivorans]